MSEKLVMARFFKLTPKAHRYVLAFEAFKKRLNELNQLSDEEILKLIENTGDSS